MTSSSSGKSPGEPARVASRYNVAIPVGRKAGGKDESRCACPGSPTPWRVGPAEITEPHIYNQVSLGAQTIKNLPAMQETRLRFLGREDPLEEETATQPSIPAWETPWTVHGAQKTEQPSTHTIWTRRNLLEVGRERVKPYCLLY